MSSALGQLSRPVTVVANRLPVDQGPDGWRASSGGLVTALQPVMDEAGGSWIGWDGGHDDVPRRVPDLNVDLHAVPLSRHDIDGYYHGFSNRTLWPLFHDLLAQPVIDRGWWRTYEAVNRRFAEATADLPTSELEPWFWIHDYQLLLVPRLVRGLHPTAPVGFFLHIPFPPPELVARLPWRDNLLHGMLAADAVGFHTEIYRDNFARSVQRLIPGVGELGNVLALPDGRHVVTAAHPISIDAGAFAALATDDETEKELEDLRAQFAGRRVFLGVDRLDYTKGIRHRLQAIELLLERNPALRRQFAFVQVAVPSRDDVQEYRDLRTNVETEVGRINGRFTEPGGDVPVHYLFRRISKTRLAAYYRVADVMCVTPLKDGMNLVAKEFVVCQDAGDEAGVLLLSDFAGAVREFADDAVRCNPFDVEGLSFLMESALELEPADRRSRIARMAQRVREHDVFAWVDDELAGMRRSGVETGRLRGPMAPMPGAGSEPRPDTEAPAPDG